MKPTPVPGSNTVNPAGSPDVNISAPALRPPSPEVAERQDPKHSESDFARDLKKATRRKSS